MEGAEQNNDEVNEWDAYVRAYVRYYEYRIYRRLRTYGKRKSFAENASSRQCALPAAGRSILVTIAGTGAIS